MLRRLVPSSCVPAARAGAWAAASTIRPSLSFAMVASVQHSPRRFPSNEGGGKPASAAMASAASELASRMPQQRSAKKQQHARDEAEEQDVDDAKDADVASGSGRRAAAAKDERSSNSSSGSSGNSSASSSNNKEGKDGKDSGKSHHKEGHHTSSKIKHKPNHVTGENVTGLWGIYLRFLHTRPVLAVFATAVVLWGIGDAISQAMEKRLRVTRHVTEAVDQVEDEDETDYCFKWRRWCGAVLDGSIVAGVGGYYWYAALDRFVTVTCSLRHGTLAFVSTKMLLEFLIWHPLNLVAFWLVVGIAEGDTLSYITSELREDFLPTLAGEYALWGPLDVLNFAFVPVHLQVILVNVVSLIESVFLSYVRSQGFPGFPQPACDSLEDRGMPISIIDVLRSTDVSFERALRDGAKRFQELDVDDKGYIVAGDITAFMRRHRSVDHDGNTVMDVLLPGIPCERATEASSELLIRHAEKKGHVTRREYLRFVGELNHAAYRTSLLPEVCFTLFDASERHMITGAALIELAHLLYDNSAEGLTTLNLMMPALETLRSKELTVDEASALLTGLDTLMRFHKNNHSLPHAPAVAPAAAVAETESKGGLLW